MPKIPTVISTYRYVYQKSESKALIKVNLIYYYQVRLWVHGTGLSVDSRGI